MIKIVGSNFLSVKIEKRLPRKVKYIASYPGKDGPIQHRLFKNKNGEIIFEEPFPTSTMKQMIIDRVKNMK